MIGRVLLLNAVFETWCGEKGEIGRGFGFETYAEKRSVRLCSWCGIG